MSEAAQALIGGALGGGAVLAVAFAWYRIDDRRRGREAVRQFDAERRRSGGGS